MGLGGLTGAGLVVSSSVIGGGGGGDVGDFNGWDGATLAAAVTAAGANLATGDLLLVGAELYYAYVGGDNVGTHAIPMSLPTSPAASPDTTGALGAIPTILTAFQGVNPETAGISDWTLTETNSGTLSITDGVLTLSAPGASDRAYLAWAPTSGPDTPFVAILYDVAGACTNAISAQGPQWAVRTDASDRVIIIRPDQSDPTDPSSPWEIDTVTTDPAVAGSAVGTSIPRMEIYVDPTTSPAAIRVRVGGPGAAWQAADEELNTLSSANKFFIDSGRNAAGQSLSFSGMVLAQVAS